MRKSFMKVLLSLVVMCMVSVNATAETVNTISLSLQRNDDLTIELFNPNKETYFEKNEIENLSFVFSRDKKNLSINGDLDIDLVGDAIAVNVGNSVGYIGLYEGFITENIPVTIDVTFNSNEALTSLTVGYLGDEEFGTAFFGSLTDTISAIDNVYNQQISQMRLMVDEEEMLQNKNAGVQPLSTLYAGAKLQKNVTTSSGGYIVGELSVFHAPQLIAQGSLPILVKVNTKKDNVVSYLGNQGYDASTMYLAPNQFVISIEGNHESLGAVTNSYKPQNGQTSLSIPLPYCTSISNKTMEVTTINLRTSSTSVTTSSKGGSILDNKITWTMQRSSFDGWLPTEFDGDETSTRGMTTNATFTYAGDITSDLSRTISSTARIRYWCQYWIDGVQRTMNFTTNQMSATSSVTIKNPLG